MAEIKALQEELVQKKTLLADETVRVSNLIAPINAKIKLIDDYKALFNANSDPRYMRKLNFQRQTLVGQKTTLELPLVALGKRIGICFLDAARLSGKGRG